MNTYIQNKLDDIRNQIMIAFKHLEHGVSFFNGIPVMEDLEEENMNQIIDEALKQALTDYHNHIAKHLRCCDCDGSGAYQSPSDYSPCKNCDGTGLRPDGSLNDLLQDTNPKE